jgi:hypothetical protein
MIACQDQSHEEASWQSILQHAVSDPLNCVAAWRYHRLTRKPFKSSLPSISLCVFPNRIWRA